MDKYLWICSTAAVLILLICQHTQGLASSHDKEGADKVIDSKSNDPAADKAINNLPWSKRAWQSTYIWGKRDSDEDEELNQEKRGWKDSGMRLWGKRGWGDKTMRVWGKRSDLDDKRGWKDSGMRVWGKRDGELDEEMAKRQWGKNTMRVWGKRDDDKRGWKDSSMRMWGKRSQLPEEAELEEYGLQGDEDQFDKRKWGSDNMRLWGKRGWKDSNMRMWGKRGAFDDEDDKRGWKGKSMRMWGKRDMSNPEIDSNLAEKILKSYHDNEEALAPLGDKP